MFERNFLRDHGDLRGWAPSSTASSKRERREQEQVKERFLMATGYGKASHNIRTFVHYSLPCYIFSAQVRPAIPSIRKRPRRQARGIRTREAIMARAVDIASRQGLEGLTARAPSRNTSV